jgi:hypothetical protein
MITLALKLRDHAILLLLEFRHAALPFWQKSKCRVRRDCFREVASFRSDEILLQSMEMRRDYVRLSMPQIQHLSFFTTDIKLYSLMLENIGADSVPVGSYAMDVGFKHDRFECETG